MASSPSSPLLGGARAADDDRLTVLAPEPEESTPLLSGTDETSRCNGEEEEEHTQPLAAVSSPSPQDERNARKSRTPWPTIIAILVLAALIVSIITGVFFAPAVIEQYAKESLVIEPTNLSIDSFTPKGVRARIQANFRLDASKVKNDAVRSIGRVGTWIARQVESGEAKVEVYLPEYGNLLLGTAMVPKVVVNIRDGYVTPIDFFADLEAGDTDGVLRVANDWLKGKLGRLRVQGNVDVTLKSGLIPLGSQRISESLVFEGNNIPDIPKYNITYLNFHEIDLPLERHGMAANVTLKVVNTYPIKLTVPPLSFDILAPNCASNEPYVALADAITEWVDVEPHSDIEVDVGGIVEELSKPLTRICPDSGSSPLDKLLGGYIHGKDTTIFVRGSSLQSPDTPEWMTKIMSSVTVPVPFPGHSLGNLIQNFSLSDVDFTLPNPFADPRSPESMPQVSGTIEVIAALPKEMNFGFNVTRVRANANVFYEGKELGVLDLKKWQMAKSERIEPIGGIQPAIKIESQIKNAPLEITNQDVFSDLVQALFFRGAAVVLKVEALVDAEVETVLGPLVIRDIPGDGEVPVQALSPDGLSNLKPQIYDLAIVDTDKTTLHITAKVNVSNPTNYTATIHYASLYIVKNGSIIAEATVNNMTVVKGNNTNLQVNVTWDPYNLGGNKSQIVGRDLLSQYVSGWNTTLAVRTHRGSIPTQPELGEALAKFEIEVPISSLLGPGDGSDDDGKSQPGRPHFIKDATFHIFSSTADFTLLSPLQQTPIYIETINATAFYNHTEAIGNIISNLPFKVPPGLSTTPRLPVDWSPDNVGYEKLKNALGGGLKLDAQADIGIRVGHWSEKVWYVGTEIGAKVRF